MQERKVKAIVIKSVTYGEGDKILTLLSTEGKISVMAKGIKRSKSKRLPLSQPMCYGEFVLKKSHSMEYLVEGDVIESFYPVHQSVEKLSLAAYFLEVTEKVAMEGDVDPVLSWLLNCLYILSYKELRLDVLKIIFEWHLMVLLGFGPHMESCVSCGNELRYDRLFFHCMEGGMVCMDCYVGEVEHMVLIYAESYKALCYLVNEPPQKLFSVSIPTYVVDELSYLSKRFRNTHLELELASETYYEKIFEMDKNT